MENHISCGKLLVTWLLIGAMFLLYEKFGDAGLIAAIGPMVIAQRMRLAHDRLLYAHLKENRIWMWLTATYYVLLLVVAIVSAAHGVKLYHLSTVLFVAMLFFPILMAMIINDIRTCLIGKKRE